VIGATASLAGVSRMTISLCVIVLETTQDLEFLMPIMMTIIIAKWVGDLFNISLYDLHVELRCIPFVEQQPSGNQYHSTACDIMNAPVLSLPQKVTAADVIQLLNKCSHNGFPVVVAQENPKFCGLILRSQLVVMLNKQMFGCGEAALEGVCLNDFATSLSSKHKVLAPFDLARYGNEILDLSMFMNPAPSSVQRSCPLSRVHVMFRSLGLRHLPVINGDCMIEGIIGRKEIMSQFEHDLS
jgi:chloride channel 7